MASELESLLIRFEADTSRLRAAFAAADAQTGQFAGKINARLAQTEKRFDAFAATARRALAGLAAVQVTRGTIAMADAYTQLQNRLKFVTQSGAELTHVQKALFASSQETRVGVQETTELFARMSFALKDAGVSQNEVIQFTENLNKALILSGASAAEAGGALTQLSQGLAAGTLRGQELNSVMEQIPFVAKLIADRLGVTTGELRKMGEQGKITGKEVFEALISSTGELDKRFKETVPTVSQSLTVLNNSFFSFVGQLNESTGASNALANAILGVANAFDHTNKAVQEKGGFANWLTRPFYTDYSKSDRPHDGAPAQTVGNLRSPERKPAVDQDAAAKKAAEDLRKLEAAWRDLRNAQMDTLNDLIDMDSVTMAEKLEALRVAVKNGEIGWWDYANAVNSVERQNAQNMDNLLSTTAQTLDAVFKESKTAAIASALINTYQGITKALTLPPPYSFAMAALTAAQGFAQVNAIRSQSKSSGAGAAPAASAGAAAGGAAASGAASAGPDRVLAVRGISLSEMLGRDGLRGLMEALVDAQRDGFRLVYQGG